MRLREATEPQHIDKHNVTLRRRLLFNRQLRKQLLKFVRHEPDCTSRSLATYAAAIRPASTSRAPRRTHANRRFFEPTALLEDVRGARACPRTHLFPLVR